MRTFRRLVTICATLAVGAAGGGLAVASIPSSNGVIHSCYSKSTGSLRVVSSTRCPRGQASLAWNQRGPRGLKGNTGAQGPGAQVLRFTSDTTNSRFTVLRRVSGYTFEAKCTVSSGSSTVEMDLIIPNGVTVAEAGSVIDSINGDAAFAGSRSGVIDLIQRTGSSSDRDVTALQDSLIGPSQKSMQVSATVIANPDPVSASHYCEIDGIVTPTS